VTIFGIDLQKDKTFVDEIKVLSIGTSKQKAELVVDANLKNRVQYIFDPMEIESGQSIIFRRNFKVQAFGIADLIVGFEKQTRL